MQDSALVCLPSTPIKQFQIECNAPLNAIITRVEKEPSPSSRWTSTSADQNSSPENKQPERIFFPLPRAHEIAVTERERTLQRIEAKQNRLDKFLQQTKARVSATEDSIKVVAKAEAIAVQEKTRRKLDQSVALIPKPTAVLYVKRSIEMQGGQHRLEGVGKGGKREVRGASHVRSAEDIAAELGQHVLSDLSEAMKARRALMSQKRKSSGEDDKMDIQSSPSSARASSPDSPVAANHQKSAGQVRKDLGASLLDASRIEVWEGEMKQAMREKKARETVYSEVRKSLMSGERLRVREVRKEREDQEMKERQEEEARRMKDDEARIRQEAEERLEKLRQQTVLKTLAMRLAAEKDVEARLDLPKRQQVESSRFAEAMRHKLLDAIHTKCAPITPFCPCVPPRSVADNRLHMCASNCPLRDNWRAYYRLVTDTKNILGIQD